ncbi:MAG: FxLYD domain-containing protein [Gammaproteobacteria bacterium]|nr:FxLYD domain-containing protein [Gammaproteobacteria bacterium]
MNEWGKWQLIKAGFWLGIGFIVPSAAVLLATTVGSVWIMPTAMEASGWMGGEDATDMTEDFRSRYDKSDQVRIVSYRETRTGNRLLVLGEIENAGKGNVTSVHLEAELKDKNGKFVYECSDYINRKLASGDKENFQISCGCGSNPLPEYATVDVRVVSANSF